MVSVSLKEKIKGFLIKNKKENKTLQQEKAKQVDSKYYDIFDLYYYVESGTESRPKVAYAYQKGDHYYDCKTGDFLASPNIVSKCFVFDAEKIKDIHFMNANGACFANKAKANYLDYEIEFHYGMKEMRSGDDVYNYFNSEDIKSYDDNIKISGGKVLQIGKLNLSIYYNSKCDVSVQPKLCLALTDLMKSEEVINSYLKNKYRGIDTLVEQERLNDLKKQQEEADYKKLTNKIKERVI